jgi:hypothetical protein
MVLEFIGLTFNSNFNNEINNEINNEQNVKLMNSITNNINSPKKCLTPKTKMRKIKSEEDFIKIQVPWII